MKHLSLCLSVFIFLSCRVSAQTPSDSIIITGIQTIYDLRPWAYSSPQYPVLIKSDATLLIQGAYRARWWHTQSIDIEPRGRIIVDGGFCDNFVYKLKPGASIIIRNRTEQGKTLFGSCTASDSDSFHVPLGATFTVEQGATFQYPCTNPLNPPSTL